ncbi:Bardet-Biedl syndrome 2 protein, partial [Irineochytrium annulatum]
VALTSSAVDDAGQETLLRELFRRKQKLEEAALAPKKAEVAPVPEVATSSQEAVAPEPKTVRCELVPRLDADGSRGGLYLRVEAPADANVHLIIIRGEGILDKDSVAFQPKPSPTVSVRVPIARDASATLDLLITCASSNPVPTTTTNPLMQTHRLSLPVPRFARYVSLEPARLGATRPASSVTFRVDAGAAAVQRWIGGAFLSWGCVEYAGNGLEAVWVCVADSLPELVRGRLYAEGLTLVFSSRQMTIRCDDTSRLGDLIQDLCSHLSVTELDVRSHLPRETQILEQLVPTLGDDPSAGGPSSFITADTGELSELVAGHLLRAEDDLRIFNMTGVKAQMASVIDLTRDAALSHVKRMSHAQQRQEAARLVSASIQRCAGLRLGRARAAFLGKSRKLMAGGGGPEGR